MRHMWQNRMEHQIVLNDVHDNVVKCERQSSWKMHDRMFERMNPIKTFLYRATHPRDRFSMHLIYSLKRSVICMGFALRPAANRVFAASKTHEFLITQRVASLKICFRMIENRIMGNAHIRGSVLAENGQKSMFTSASNDQNAINSHVNPSVNVLQS